MQTLMRCREKLLDDVCDAIEGDAEIPSLHIFEDDYLLTFPSKVIERMREG